MVTYNEALEMTRNRYSEAWHIYRYTEYDKSYEFGLSYSGDTSFSENERINKSTGDIDIIKSPPFSIEDLRLLFPELALIDVPDTESLIKKPRDMYIRCGKHESTVLSPKEAFDLLKYKTKRKYRRDYLDTPEAYVFFSSDEENSVSFPLWLVYKDSLECREILKDVDYGFKADSIVHNLLFIGR